MDKKSTSRNSAKAASLPQDIRNSLPDADDTFHAYVDAAIGRRPQALNELIARARLTSDSFDFFVTGVEKTGPLAGSLFGVIVQGDSDGNWSRHPHMFVDEAQLRRKLAARGDALRFDDDFKPAPLLVCVPPRQLVPTGRTAPSPEALDDDETSSSQSGTTPACEAEPVASAD